MNDAVELTSGLSQRLVRVSLIINEGLKVKDSQLFSYRHNNLWMEVFVLF